MRRAPASTHQRSCNRRDQVLGSIPGWWQRPCSPRNARCGGALGRGCPCRSLRRSCLSRSLSGSTCLAGLAPGQQRSVPPWNAALRARAACSRRKRAAQEVVPRAAAVLAEGAQPSKLQLTAPTPRWSGHTPPWRRSSGCSRMMSRTMMQQTLHRRPLATGQASPPRMEAFIQHHLLCSGCRGTAALLPLGVTRLETAGGTWAGGSRSLPRPPYGALLQQSILL